MHLALAAWKLATTRHPELQGDPNWDQIAENGGPHWRDIYEGKRRCNVGPCAEYYQIIDRITRGEKP